MQNSQYWRIEKGKKKLYPHTAESSRRGGLTAQLLCYLLDRKEGWKGKGEIWKDSLSAFISFFSLNLKWFSFYTVLRGYCNFGLATLVDNLKATPQGHLPLSRLLCPWTFNTIHQLQNISASPGNSEVVPSLPLRFPVHICYCFVRRCIIIIWIYSLCNKQPHQKTYRNRAKMFTLNTRRWDTSKIFPVSSTLSGQLLLHKGNRE